MILLVAAVAVIAVAAIAVVLAARRVGRDHARSNEVVPGVPTRAPIAWAGAHTPEARLHRRLRDAVSSARAMGDGARAQSARATIEQEALALDERLIVDAALPEPLRGEPLARLKAAVRHLEQAVATLAASAAELDAAAMERTLAATDEHLRLLAEASAEIDRLDQGGGASA